MTGRIVLQQKPLILLVEQDVSARDLMKLLLSSQGYEVLDTDPLTDASEIWEAFRQVIAVVVVGFVEDSALRARLLFQYVQYRPDLKVVIANGYDRNKVTNVIDMEGCWFIRKPFHRETTLGMVGKILSHRASKPPAP